MINPGSRPAPINVSVAFGGGAAGPAFAQPPVGFPAPATAQQPRPSQQPVTVSFAFTVPTYSAAGAALPGYSGSQSNTAMNFLTNILANAALKSAMRQLAIRDLKNALTSSMLGLGGPGGLGGLGGGLGGLGGSGGGPGRDFGASGGMDPFARLWLMKLLSDAGVQSDLDPFDLDPFGLDLFNLDPFASDPFGTDPFAANSAGGLLGPGDAGGLDGGALRALLKAMAGPESPMPQPRDGRDGGCEAPDGAATEVELTAADVGKEIGDTGFTLLAIDGNGAKVTDGTQTYEIGKDQGGQLVAYNDKDGDGDVESKVKDWGDPHREVEHETPGSITLAGRATVERREGGGRGESAGGVTVVPGAEHRAGYDFDKDNVIAWDNGAKVGERVTAKGADGTNYLQDVTLRSGGRDSQDLKFGNLHDGKFTVSVGRNLYDFANTATVREDEGFADGGKRVTKA